MRKWNAVLSAAILALFLLHGILGAFQMLGVGDTALKHLARGTVALTGIHALIGLKLTWDSLRVWRRTGISYWKENRLYWTRRISGFAILALIGFHLTAFGYESPAGAARLRPFGAFRLAVQLALAAAVAVHVLSNCRPLLIALGLPKTRRYLADLLFVLSVLLLFMAAAFVVYYLRWKAV